MKKELNSYLLGWEPELNFHLHQSKALGIAVINNQFECLYLNDLMSGFLNHNPKQHFINPTLQELFAISTENKKVFSGILTLGNQKAFDVSFDASIYRNKQNLIIFAEINAEELSTQNETINSLNIEITNLQRQLIKEKRKLQQTYNELELKTQDLETLNIKLTALNKEKNLILGVAAHDIRSPLATISSLAEILSDDTLEKTTEDTEKFLHHIKTAAQKSLHLTNELLDISKIESGNTELHIEVNNYLELLKEAIQINSFHAKKKNIHISFTYEADITQLKYDDQKIQQVVNNLISNALKYSNHFSNIVIRVSQLTNALLTEVIDFGQGISEEDLKKIFIPFNQGSSKVTGGEHSTGLGLAIVKKILVCHHSQINVTSELGKGNVFSFELPF